MQTITDSFAELVAEPLSDKVHTEPQVDALNDRLAEVKAKTLIDTVADVMA